MNYIYFKEKLESIDKINFNYSLEESLSLHELNNIYIKLLELKEEFFINSFENSSLVEIEEVRVGLLENILNIRILIKEKRNLKCDTEIIIMKKLFTTWNKRRDIFIKY